VLLAYSKMWLNDELIASDLPEDPWVATALERYFPTQLKEKFAPTSRAIRCKREIIATHVLNSMVNRVGPTFVHRLGEITGATPPQVVRAYLASREVFGLVPLWQQIEALDNKVPDEVQAEMVITLRAWSRAPPPGSCARAACSSRRSSRWPASRRRCRRCARGSKRRRSRRAPRLDPGRRAPPLAAQVDRPRPVQRARHRRDRRSQQAAAGADGAGARRRRRAAGLERMRQQIELLPADSYWQGLAKLALADDLTDLQRSIAQEALGHHHGDAAQVLDRWEQGNRQALERAQRLLAELQDTPGRPGDAVGGAAGAAQPGAPIGASGTGCSAGCKAPVFPAVKAKLSVLPASAIPQP
jgi:glutamate dehydrogenase